MFRRSPQFEEGGGVLLNLNTPVMMANLLEEGRRPDRIF
jgi:hypothetical protein